MKKIFKNVASNFAAALSIGLIGVVFLALGALWRPLIIVGAILIIIALFIANIWP